MAKYVISMVAILNVSTRLRGGKIKKAKKTIKSFWAKTFNFGHMSDIPHQTIILIT